MPSDHSDDDFFERFERSMDQLHRQLDDDGFDDFSAFDGVEDESDEGEHATDAIIDDLIRDILNDAAATPDRPTPPRLRDIGRAAGRASRRRSGSSPVLATRLLEIIYAHLDGCSMLIASTAAGTGAYGRLTVDPLHSIELRLFGWPRLAPCSPEVDRDAIATLLAHDFALDDGDWVWKVSFRPELVPVAAHTAQRVIAAAWRIGPDEATEQHIRLVTLDSAEMMLIAAGLLCSRCVASECAGPGSH